MSIRNRIVASALFAASSVTGFGIQPTNAGREGQTVISWPAPRGEKLSADYTLRVNGKDVTDAPGGTQSANVIDDCEHELIGMERAFHQRFNLTGAGHGDGERGSSIAVLRWNDLVRC